MAKELFDLMQAKCPACENYMSCSHLFHPTLACPDETLVKYCKLRAEEKSKSTPIMSPMEREELTRRIKGMSPEEQMLTAECLPTDILYRELGMRLLTQKGFIEKMLQDVDSYKNGGHTC